MISAPSFLINTVLLLLFPLRLRVRHERPPQGGPELHGGLRAEDHLLGEAHTGQDEGARPEQQVQEDSPIPGIEPIGKTSVFVLIAQLYQKMSGQCGSGERRRSRRGRIQGDGDWTGADWRAAVPPRRRGRRRGRVRDSPGTLRQKIERVFKFGPNSESQSAERQYQPQATSHTDQYYPGGGGGGGPAQSYQPNFRKRQQHRPQQKWLKQLKCCSYKIRTNSFSKQPQVCFDWKLRKEDLLPQEEDGSDVDQEG